MSNDYLKQLQLTKQLEQKAKEATKNRKVAEETLAKAEEILNKARGPDIDLSEAEKMLAEGSAAFSRRDYTSALVASARILEIVPEARQAAVVSVLSSSEAILSQVIGDGREGDVRGAMVNARGLLEQGRVEDALAAAKSARDQAERYLSMRISEMAAGIRSLIALAEGQGIASAERKQALAEADELHKKGERWAALEKLRSVRDELMKAFAAVFEDRSLKVTAAIKDAAGAGVDISALSAGLSKARSDLGVGAVEKAMAGLTAAEKAMPSALAKAIEARLSVHAGRAAWLDKKGFCSEEYLTASGKVAEAIKAGDGAGSLEWLRRCEKALLAGEAEAVLSDIQALRPGLVLAKKVGYDLSGILGILENARREVQDGRAPRAMELVNEAASELDALLRGHQELEDELGRTAKMFRRARVAGVSLKAAGEAVARSRETALKGDLKGAVQRIRDAQGVMLQKIRRCCAEAVLDYEVDVAFASGMGTDMAPEAAELEELVLSLKEGGSDDTLIKVFRIGRQIRRKGREKAAASVEEAERAVVGIPGIELYLPVDEAREARKLLEIGDWKAAHLAAADVLNRTAQLQRMVLDVQMARTTKLMEIGKQLGCESITLDQKMASASSSETITGALGILGEIVQYIKAIIRDEMGHSIASLNRNIGAQRKNGLVVDNAERIAEEASDALELNDLEGSYTLLKDGEKELQKIVALHKEVGDLIALIAKNLDEARPAAGKYSVPTLLQETKRLYEAGKYDGAKVSARKCYHELEKTGASVLAPQKLREAEEIVKVLGQVVSGPTEADEEVKKAGEAMVRGDHAAALAAAKEAHRKGTARLVAGIVAEIDSTKNMLTGGKRRRLDLPVSFDLIEAAEAFLSNKRYADAIQAVRTARNDAEQIVRTERSARLELERGEAELAEIEEVGLDIAEARSAMIQAFAALEGGEHDNAVETGRKALKTARKVAKAALNSRLEGLEKERGTDLLQGKDLEALGSEFRRSVQKRLDRHRYPEARRLLEEYESRLKALRSLRDECEAALSENVDASKGEWPIMNEAADLLKGAGEAFRAGAFEEAQALLKERRAAMAAAEALHERSAARLAEARRAIEEGADRRFLNDRVNSMLRLAEEELTRGRYAEAERHTMRARTELTLSKERRVRRDVAEVVRLTGTLRLLGVNLYSLPERTQALLDMKMNELDDGNGMYLSEDIAALRQAAFDHLASSEASLREKVERARTSGKQTGLSEALLDAAKQALAEEDSEGALALQRVARAALGASTDDADAHRKALMLLYKGLTTARLLEIDVSGAVALHRQASLMEGDLPSATRRLAEAAEELEEKLAPYLPDVRLEAVSEERSAGGRGKVKIKAQNVGGGIALDLTVAEGDAIDLRLPDMLRPGETVEGYIEAGSSLALSYRGLMFSTSRIAKASLT